MRPIHHLALCLAALSAVAAPAAPPSALRAPQENHQQIYDDFVLRFRQFHKINAAEDLAQLVRRLPAPAIRFADDLTEKVAQANSDELEKEVQALRVAWKTAMKTDFVENLYEYQSLLEPRIRNDRLKLRLEYDKALGRYAATASGDRSATGFAASSSEFEALCSGFEKVGDKLNIGRCQIVIMNCWDETQRGKEANFYRACAAAKAALAAYDEIGMAGPDVASLRARYESLVAGGFDVAEPDPNAPMPGQPTGAGAAPAVNVAMTFEALPEVEVYQRPNYFADDIYQIWSALPLGAKDSTATIAAMSGRSPTIVRTASAQFGVDDAGDSVRDSYAVTGKLTLVQAVINDEAGKRPWAFVTKVGLQDDTYQGVKANMGPSDQYMSLFYYNAASVVGTLDGVAVRVLDDNLDGVYGSLPITWQYLGLAPDTSQPDVDCVVIGEGTRAVPWSEYLPVNGKWYKLEPQSGGMALRATQVELQTGRLRLEFKGERPEWLVMRGAGVLENTFVDLCAGGKEGLDVPVGEYRLLSGMIRKGKKQQAMKCLVLGNEHMTGFRVNPGAETVVKLGGPFRFEFERAEMEGIVVVSGPSVKVVGEAGETYDRFWNCVPAPTVSVRKAGAKKGGKPEDMLRVNGSLDELKEDGTRKWAYADVWRPLSTPVAQKKEGEEVEIQLAEKKHKLLGDIESAWR